MRGAITAALLAAASPVAAQDRMTQDQCAQGSDALADLVAVQVAPVEVQLDADGWCHVADVEFTIDPGTLGRIDMLRWRASDIARFIDAGLPPRSIDLEGRGFSVVPVTGDAVFDYLLGIQNRDARMAFGAALRWDGVQNAVTLETAYLEFDATNRIEATAHIDGVNLSDRDSMLTSIGTAGLRDVTFRSTFDGWFEAYAAMSIGLSVLENSETPVPAQVTALQDQAIEIMTQLPKDVIAEPSRAAISTFVTALPNPRGTAQLQLSAEPSAGIARTALIAREAPILQSLNALLDGVSVVFTWTPSGDVQ